MHEDFFLLYFMLIRIHWIWISHTHKKSLYSMQFWKMDIYYRMVTSNKPPASRPYILTRKTIRKKRRAMSQDTSSPNWKSNSITIDNRQLYTAVQSYIQGQATIEILMDQIDSHLGSMYSFGLPYQSCTSILRRMARAQNISG